MVQEDVGPKREALAAANVKLGVATEKLGVVQAKLEALEVGNVFLLHAGWGGKG